MLKRLLSVVIKRKKLFFCLLVAFIITIIALLFFNLLTWANFGITVAANVAANVIVSFLDFLSELLEDKKFYDGASKAKIKGAICISKRMLTSVIVPVIVPVLLNHGSYDNVAQNDVSHTSIIESKPSSASNEIHDIQNILLGTWSGDYFVGQIRTNLDLIITDFNYVNNIISAYLRFSLHPTNRDVPCGTFSMRGSISEDKAISLEGWEWIGPRPVRIDFIDINATLDVDRMIITSLDETKLSLKKISDDTTFDRDTVTISSEGYLALLQPWRKEGISGFMINNDYNTVYGYIPSGFEATSSTRRYDQIITVSSNTPFDLVYHLGGEFTTISGRIGFDDRTVSTYDGGRWGIIGVLVDQYLIARGDVFRGEAIVTFLSNGVSLVENPITISTGCTPQPFIIDVRELDYFIIRFDFPYNPYFRKADTFLAQHNHSYIKYFNLIEVRIE